MTTLRMNGSLGFVLRMGPGCLVCLSCKVPDDSFLILKDFSDEAVVKIMNVTWY